MQRIGGDSTDTSLLRGVASLEDQVAWTKFVKKYEPVLRRWCHRYRLDSDLADELCQRMWVELMRRMPSLQFDPAGSFRGWLWGLFRFRVLNLLRERNAEVGMFVDVSLIDVHCREVDETDDEYDELVLSLLSEAEDIHARVKARVKPDRWEAYWRIVILGEDIGETAALLGMKYGSAYAAARYVDKMVREEIRRRK